MSDDQSEQTTNRQSASGVTKKTPGKQRNIGVAVAIGVSCGVALGVSQEDPALGMGVGIALAAAMWSSGIGGGTKQEKSGE